MQMLTTLAADKDLSIFINGLSFPRGLNFPGDANAKFLLRIPVLVIVL